MKKKLRHIIGSVEFRESQNGGFFSGTIRGERVTMNRIVDKKDGREKWLINEEIDVFEVADDYLKNNKKQD